MDVSYIKKFVLLNININININIVEIFKTGLVFSFDLF